MVQSHTSPRVLVALLAAALFLVRTAALMLGPLLVALAAAFHTSVAAAGQLAAAISLSWGLTALFVGPLSDTYGRRRVGLTGLLVMAVGYPSAKPATPRNESWRSSRGSQKLSSTPN